MFELLVLVKIVATMSLVLGLSLLAENVSPRVAGVLSGYPLGTAIVLFFIAFENGLEFAASSSEYALSGLSAQLIFVYVYYRSSYSFFKSSVILPSIVSILCFIAVSVVLLQFSFTMLESLLLTVLAILFFSVQFRKIDNVQVGSKAKLSYKVFLFRSLFAGALVVFISGASQHLGPEWSGLLSAFPITLFPLLVIIHLTYGKELAHIIIKHYTHGVGALVVYTSALVFIYPKFGVYYGTLLCFLAATFYLVCYALGVHYGLQKKQ